MSLEQCNRCIYRDTIVVEGELPFCPVAERLTPGDPCNDYEEDDGRWNAAGTGGPDA